MIIQVFINKLVKLDSLFCKNNGNIMEQQIIHIHGIMQRSGTNYFQKLLLYHKRCHALAPVYEDFTLHHAYLLNDYSERVYKSMKKTWNVNGIIGPPTLFYPLFGKSIREFFLKQVTSENPNLKYYVSKVPSTQNTHYFFDYFPNDKLIVIVRDGRSVVSSAMKAFNWRFEHCVQKWAHGAHEIMLLQKKVPAEKFLIVKYEDLVRDTNKTMTQVLSYLDLDSGEYDFESANNMGVIGSSDLVEKHKKMHWGEVKKDANFDPINRFKGWNKWKHSRFNWIAGSYMSAFNYRTVRAKRNYLINRIVSTYHKSIFIAASSNKNSTHSLRLFS
jgi:hypothetical protein